MLESQLRKFWLFNYIGGFSVNPGSRSVVESLNHAAELLENEGNLVLIFPQGKINSIHNQRIVFEKGVEHILKRAKKEVKIVFLTILTDYFSSEKPGLYFYVEEYKAENTSTQALEEAYNAFYNQCTIKQNKLAK